MLGMLTGLLLPILLIGLSVLNSRLMERKALSSKYDYYIAEGVDYANGKLLKTKVLKDKTIVWTKYEKNEMFTPLFTKYNLHHDKPLIDYLSSCGGYYIKNPFIYLYIPEHPGNPWHFWHWKWHFFEDMQSGIFDDDFESAFSLFEYLNKNNLPIEEVQNMYKEFVRVFDDEKKRSSFCLDFIDSHEKQAIIDFVAQTAKTGELTPASRDWIGIGRCILKYRNDFPDNLPEAIMNQLSNTYRGYGDYDWLPEKTHLLSCNYLLNNYLLRPTEFNALHAFLFEVHENQILTRHGENCLSCLDEMFTILLKHGLLEKCLSQIYSEDVDTPPLPAPAAVPPDDDFHYWRNIYYTDTYENLPQREKLLKISCFPEIFKTYWENRLKRLQEKQKEK